jgi:hypothetical protein
LRALLNKRLPALLITGDITPDRLQDAHNHDISLLHKPLSPDQLRQTILTLSSTTPQ